MSDLFEPDTFQEIRIGNIGVMAAGGTVDISRPEDVRENKTVAKPEWERRTYMTLSPALARLLADALLKAANACGGGW
ncbi:MAG TPA: hypothetical protein VIR04_00470 [Paralcaligenes sp.]